MKERNVGIDILKFLAIILITNSHFELLYGKYSALATGGAIGNVMFFFCSGFTLFLKPFNSIADFPNWYKRRINRIYPTVFATAIVLCTFWNLTPDINYIILYGGRWFITLIMVYYVFLYFIGLYGRDKINWVLLLITAAVLIWFFFYPVPLYADDGLKNKWLPYFIFMLFGAKMGMTPLEEQTKYQWRNGLLALLGVVAFYVISGVTLKYDSLKCVHALTILPLLMVLYFSYLWANGSFAKSVYHTKWGHFLIRFVGGLCLEIYLIQNYLFTDKLNAIFPLNIPIVFCVIVVAAYLLRCFARLISQTFKDAPYDWKKMISIY